jgi:hypothetical protein
VGPSLGLGVGNTEGIEEGRGEGGSEGLELGRGVGAPVSGHVTQTKSITLLMPFPFADG